MRRFVAQTLVALAVALPLCAVGVGATSPSAAAAAGATGTTPSAATSPSGTSGSGIGGLSLGNAVNTPASTPQTTPTPVFPSNSSGNSSGGGLSGFDAILIAVIALALMGGIWMFVVRDARTRTGRDPAPVDDPFAAGRRKGSKAPHKPRKLTLAERKRRKRGRAPRRH